jgi:hypothetical protein
VRAGREVVVAVFVLVLGKLVSLAIMLAALTLAIEVKAKARDLLVIEVYGIHGHAHGIT